MRSACSARISFSQVSLLHRDQHILIAELTAAFSDPNRTRGQMLCRVPRRTCQTSPRPRRVAGRWLGLGTSTRSGSLVHPCSHVLSPKGSAFDAETRTFRFASDSQFGVGRDDGVDAGEFSPIFYQKCVLHPLNSQSCRDDMVPNPILRLLRYCTADSTRKRVMRRDAMTRDPLAEVDSHRRFSLNMYSLAAAHVSTRSTCRIPRPLPVAFLEERGLADLPSSALLVWGARTDTSFSPDRLSIFSPTTRFGSRECLSLHRAART